MATELFLRENAASTHRGTNTARLAGGNAGWQARSLETTRGSGVTNRGTSTVNGPTAGIETETNSTQAWEWLSHPLDQDVTISGTITINFWAREAAMADNASINCKIDRVDSKGGVVSEILKTSRTVELGTANPPTAASNFTGTPTSTNMLKGDRLRVIVFGDDSTANMVSGGAFYIHYNGATAGAEGDSYVSFTETFGFETTTPAGTQLFLTDTAGPAVGSAVEKEMWTARGDGVNSIIVNTATGWTAPIQWTDSAGGTVVEWYSKQLAAFTLADLVRCNLRCLESNSLANTGIRAEIATCDNDGTNVTVWGGGNFNDLVGNFGEIATTETAYTIDVAGDDLSVTAGQRLRLRVYIDDLALVPMVTGYTATLFYDGTSGGASGDSWIQLSQSVTEFVNTPAPPMRQLPFNLLAM